MAARYRSRNLRKTTKSQYLECQGMFLVDSSSIELTKSNSKLLADDSSSQNETRGGHFVFCSPRPPGGWEKSAHVKNQKSIPIPIYMQKIKECLFFAQLLCLLTHSFSPIRL